MLGPGTARIRARRDGALALLEIEDSAGAFSGAGDEEGLGLKSVDTRIKNLIGPEYGVVVSCIPGSLTRVTVRLPLQEV